MATVVVAKAPFGTTTGSNVRVDAYTMSCPGKGVTCTVITYGATLISVLAPDRRGVSEEVTLCYATLAELESKVGPYYGCVAGRYANRIRGGTFSVDGATYQLAVNNGPNALHGGLKGFDKHVWAAEAFDDGAAGKAGVKLTHVSPDGDEGYPGEVHVDVTYALTADGQLEVTYRAEVRGKATPINLTNHAYWNLSGNCARKVYDHRLELSCDRYLPVDATQIPTGQLAPVEGTPYDLRAHPDHRHGRRLGDVIPLIDGGGRPGVDHCFVVNGAVEDAAGAGDEPVLRLVALLTDDASGRQLVCEASQPGVQVYTANWLAEPSSVAADGGLHPSSVGEPDHPHTQHNGVCLETQHFPDAVNQPQFPSAILRPGEVYRHVAVFTFGTI